ncbi:MAG: dTMP kinase [Candidatus Woesearchaeota archaeon]
MQRLFVIEGTDGSGKGTQTRKLRERFEKEGHEVETIDFPQYERNSSGLIKEYLNGTYGSAEEVGPYRASIFYACDRYDASFKIRRWLDKGKVVIADRYVSSNMGHQASKIDDPSKRERYLKWLDHLEHEIFGIPRPTAIIYLHVPAEIGQELVKKKMLRTYIKDDTADIHEKDISHLKKAEKTYNEISEKFGWIKIECMKEGKIMDIEEIHEKIWNHIP